MAHLFQAATANDLMDAVTSRLIYNPAPDADASFITPQTPAVDMVSSVDTHLLNIVAEADSFQWGFDLKDAWLTKTRFNTLIRQYIDPVAAENWLDVVGTKLSRSRRGTAVMRTNLVQKRGGANRPSRQWGSCMLAISFRRVPHPQITLYSRTSYFGYIAYLDITAAHVLAREVSKRVGVPVEDMRFVWQIEDAQWSWKSLSYLFQSEKRTQDLWKAREVAVEGGQAWDDIWEKSPGLGVAALWFDRFLLEDEENVRYGDMTWGGCARVRRRYHTEVCGYEYGEKWEGWEGVGKLKGQSKRFKPLASCHTDVLDLSGLAKLKNAPSDEERALMANYTEDGCECLYGDTAAEDV